MANGADHELHLDGQGLVLVPSVFCSRSLVETTASSVVVSYPARGTDPVGDLTAVAPARSGSAVSDLLGKTRANVLATIAEHPGCTTKQLASLARITRATTSEHTGILRAAGLVHTSRHRNTASHVLTRLGTALLNPGSADAARQVSPTLAGGSGLNGNG
jgi:DNA-binding transcriptional ArsR family regulator